ncbi:MAG: DUF4193 family protein [Actinomycetota bacterium]|jgi:hypothetical protein|nr:DUF4193 family protein [Actinomycetota bacterium]
MADDLDDMVTPEDVDDDEVIVLDADDDLDEPLDEAEIEDDDDDLVLDDIETPVRPSALRAEEADDEEEDDEDEDEDVEASLDVILKERLVVDDDEVDDEDEDVADADDRSEGTEQVLPKQPGEFVCRSCFLVKHPSQLADKKRLLCRDCV